MHCPLLPRLHSGKGQTLQTVGTADVTAKIARVAGMADDAAITSLHVLQWAMANTVAATQRGVLEWAHQGLLFAATRGAPEHALQPEVLELAAMYGGARDWCAVPEVVAEQCGRRQKGRRPGLAADMRKLMQLVVEASRQHGEGHEVVAQGQLGEECERELEREEEEEEEVERQIPRIAAMNETDWDYGRALGATSLASLKHAAGLRLLSLGQLAAHVQPAAVGCVPWSQHVFCTLNFAIAVQQPEGEALNEYLRPVGHLLLLPAHAEEPEVVANWPPIYMLYICACPCKGRRATGSRSGQISEAGRSVLLLSEREANGLLEAMWAGSGGGGSQPAGKAAPLLVSLCHACAAPPLRLAAAAAGGGAWQAVGQMAAELGAGAFLPQLVSLQLWDGEATYAPEEPKQGQQAPRQLALLRQLVAGRGAAAEALVAMRGKQVLFSRSQLELACDADRGSA